MTADMPVRWGVIGSGGIAKSFFASAASSRSGRIVAVGSRNPDPRDLSENFPEVRQIRGYDELIADPEVEAVYVATPHVLHAQWVIAAANAGKHVLCEKPMGISVKESAAMWEAARNAGTFLGEAYMYRFHPLTARIMELLRSNAIGDVRMIRSSFGFALSRVDSGHRLFASELGGGAILDVGGYLLSMACFLAGYRSDQAWLDPVELKALAHYGPTGVDEWTSAVLKFPNGIVADLSCSISVWQENILHVMGTTGRLEVDHFWFGGGKAGGTNTIRLVRPDGSRDEIPIHDHRNLYSFQFEAVNAAIRTGKNSFEYPGLDAHQSLATARLLDTWIIEVSSTNHSACYA